MPNTSNQSLPYPAPTDPVDVPGDIQALAEAIDTKMLDKAVINAKGDLLVGSADNSVSRQGIGSNDTVLIADSAQTLGVKWAQVSTNSIADASITAAKLAAGAAVPAGVISPFAGVNAPSGWLLCDGTDVSRTTYASLFATFGTSFVAANTTNGSATVSGLSGMNSTMIGWGIAGTNIPSGATITAVSSATQVTISANATGTATGTANIAISPYGFTGAGNTTTFLLPDLRSRFIAGRGSSTWSDVLNEKAGSADLIVVSHSHTINHGHTGSVTGSGTHNHTGRFLITATGSGSNAHLARPTGYTFNDLLQNTEEGGGGHSHGLSIDTHSGSSGSSGSSGTNANLPPYITLNHIIKT